MATASARLRALLEGQLAQLSLDIDKEVAGVAVPEDEDDDAAAVALALLNPTPSCSSSGSSGSSDSDADDPLPAAASSSSWARHRLELQHAMDPGFLLLQNLFKAWRACTRPRLALRRRGQRALRRLHAQSVGAKGLTARALAGDARRALRKGLRRLQGRVACRQAGERLAERHRAATRAAAFRAWRAELALRRNARRRAKRTMARCVAAWRQGVAADKAGVAELGARLRLKRAWVAMRRAHAAKAQWADAAVCRLAVLRARRCLRRWRWEAVAKSRMRRLRGSMAVTHRRQVLARQGIAALTENAAAARAALDAVAGRLQERAVRARAVAALGRLRENAVRRQRARLAASRLLVVAARQRFGEWRRWTLQQGWERAAVAAQGRQAKAASVVRAFQRWQAFARLLSAATQVREARRRRLLGVMLGATERSRDLQAKAAAVGKRNGRGRVLAALQVWRRAAGFAACQRMLRQRRALRRLRLFVARCGLQRGIEEEVGEGHAAARRLRAGFKRWQAAVAEGRARRTMVARERELRQRVAVRMAGAALLSWRRAWMDEAEAHEAEAVGALAWRRRELRAALTTLVRMAQGRQLAARTDAAAERHWQQGRRRRGLVALQLRRWQAETARRRAAMARCWRAELGLAAWRAQAERQRVLEEAKMVGEAAAEQQWLERRLAGAFGTLCRLARLRRQGEALQRSTLASRRLAAWDAWRAQLGTLRAVRRFRRRSERERLRLLLFAWAKHAHGQQRRRAALLRDARREAKRRAFAEWRARVHRRRRLREAAGRVADNARRWRLQRALVGGWRVAYHAEEAERASRRQFLLRHGLGPWVAAVQRRREERWRAQVVAVTHARRVAQAALVVWHGARAEAARDRAAAMHHAQRLLRQRWLLASHPRRVAEAATMACAVRAWGRTRLSQSLAQWQQHVARRRRLDLSGQGKVRVAAAFGRWRRWLAERRAWAAWRERVLRWSVERPRAYEVVVSLVPSGQKGLALQAWAAFADDRARQREAVADVALLRARRVAQAALRALAGHATARRVARVDARQAEAVAGRWYLRSSLRRWRQRGAALLGERQAEADRRRLRKLLRGWAEHARHMKQARAWLRSQRGARGGEDASSN